MTWWCKLFRNATRKDELMMAAFTNETLLIPKLFSVYTFGKQLKGPRDGEVAVSTWRWLLPCDQSLIKLPCYSSLAAA